MRPCRPVGATCPYFLICLGITFVVSAPGAASYAIPPSSVATASNEDDRYSRGSVVQSSLQAVKPAPRIPLTADDGFFATLTRRFLSGSDPPSSLGDVGVFYPESDALLSTEDTLTPNAEILFPTADDLSSAEDGPMSTDDSLLSIEHGPLSVEDSSLSTANTLSPTTDILSSTAETHSSAEEDLLFSSPDSFPPPTSPASSGNNDYLVAQGFEEPHCEGVALCCTGKRILDGSLVEKCEYCAYRKLFFGPSLP